MQPLSLDGAMQAEFSFGNTGLETGYMQWHKDRDLALAELRKELGLPLGRNCEVWMKDGVRLKGVLRLREQKLFLEGESIQNTVLEIDGTPFFYREMEVCVRLDG